MALRAGLVALLLFWGVEEWHYGKLEEKQSSR